MFSSTESPLTQSTTRICFVCNNGVNLSSKTFDSVLQNFELCHRYLVLVSRYLNIASSSNTNNSFKPELSLNTKSDNWTWHLKPMDKNCENCCCCDECLPILKAFCKMYDKWTRLKLRLYGNAKTVANLFEKNENQGFGHHGQVEKLKMEFLSKVQNMPIDEFPRLRVSKIETSTNEEHREIRAPVTSDTANFSPKENIAIVIPQDVAHTNTAKKWLCTTCGKRFAYSSGLYNHLRIHKEVKQYSCPFCERKFHFKHNLTTHKRIHTGEKPYICGIPDCRKGFNQLSGLRSHQKCYHQIYRDGPIIKKFINKRAESKTSNQGCGLDDILENALQNKSSPLIASNDNIKVIDEIQVMENVIDFEDDDSVVVISPTNSPKSVSKQILQNSMPQSEVQDTELKHTEALPILMTNASAYNADQPISDRRVKTSKNWACNTCNKQFSSAASLNLHRQLHSGVKRFSCLFCERKFHQAASLVTHMRTHTREQPYVCDINNCQESFKQQSVCKYHQLRKHNVVKCGAVMNDFKKNQAKKFQPKMLSNNIDTNYDVSGPRNLLANSFSSTTEKTESRVGTEIGQPDTIKFQGANASVQVEVELDEDDDVIFIPPPIKYEVSVHPDELDMTSQSGVSFTKFDLNCLEQELDLLD